MSQRQRPHHRQRHTESACASARPKGAFEGVAGLMECDRTTTSTAVSARPTAPGTTGFEDAQAPVLPSHLMRSR